LGRSFLPPFNKPESRWFGVYCRFSCLCVSVCVSVSVYVYLCRCLCVVIVKITRLELLSYLFFPQSACIFKFLFLIFWKHIINYFFLSTYYATEKKDAQLGTLFVLLLIRLFHGLCCIRFEAYFHARILTRVNAPSVFLELKKKKSEMKLCVNNLISFYKDVHVSDCVRWCCTDFFVYVYS